MTLDLKRTYYPTGTNGVLSWVSPMCSTIELPWKNNDTGISCIPEGKYRLQKRWSLRHGKHLILEDVPNRSLILIHAANDAVKELRGCIAPVTTITGPGKGSQSKIALQKVLNLAYDAIDRGESVYLRIYS